MNSILCSRGWKQGKPMGRHFEPESHEVKPPIRNLHAFHQGVLAFCKGLGNMAKRRISSWTSPSKEGFLGWKTRVWRFYRIARTLGKQKFVYVMIVGIVFSVYWNELVFSSQESPEDLCLGVTYGWHQSLGWKSMSCRKDKVQFCVSLIGRNPGLNH